MRKVKRVATSFAFQDSEKQQKRRPKHNENKKSNMFEISISPYCEVEKKKQFGIGYFHKL